MSTVNTLLTLPFLILISIPLIVTASVTILLSSVTLFVQVTAIGVELCCAILSNLFTIPPSPNWSLLSFSVSNPSTPNRRQSSDYGFLQSPLHSRAQSRRQSQSQSRGNSRPNLGQRRSSPNALLDSPTDDHNNNHYHNEDFELYDIDDNYNFNLKRERANSIHSGFLDLISGDEDRDFEGLGGWRCPASYAKSPGYKSGRTTPSSSGGVSDEADDIAWCSMNSRLELPGQPLLLRHSSSNHNPLQRRNSRGSFQAGQGVLAEPIQANTKRARHHRRSASTGTSLLSGSGASLTPSTSPENHNHNHNQGHSNTRHSPRNGHQNQPQTAIQARGDALRSKSHGSLSEWGQHAMAASGYGSGSMASSMSSGAGSYFPLQPLTLSSEGRSGRVQRWPTSGNR
ncbi:hypothetical protein BDV19DRAFT_391043 [Aspergillus venezuelensis]